MKCLFFDYVHFWWLAWLIDELEPHLPPLSYQKYEMLNIRLRSTSDDQPSWSIDSKSICQPSPANKMKCFFLDYVHFWWSARLVDGLKLHLPPFSSQKNEMLTLGLCSLWMISQAGRWTQTPSITPLQPIKWNTHFWITFNFWWSAGLVNGLKPHSPLLSSQKMKCSFFDYVQLLMISWAGQWTWTPSASLLQPKKLNATFWITFNFWWSAGLVNGLKLLLPPLSGQKHEMLIFGLRSTSDDRPGWSMDSNPILHPSPAKKVKCSFLYYIQHVMLARLVNGLEPNPPPLSSQKYEMLIFGLHSTSDD